MGKRTTSGERVADAMEQAAMEEVLTLKLDKGDHIELAFDNERGEVAFRTTVFGSVFMQRLLEGMEGDAPAEGILAANTMARACCAMVEAIEPICVKLNASGDHHPCDPALALAFATGQAIGIIIGGVEQAVEQKAIPAAYGAALKSRLQWSADIGIRLGQESIIARARPDGSGAVKDMGNGKKVTVMDAARDGSDEAAIKAMLGVISGRVRAGDA